MDAEASKAAADRLIDRGQRLEDQGSVEAALVSYRDAAAVAPRLVASPLMDAERFTRTLESLYRSIWRAWCAG